MPSITQSILQQPFHKPCTHTTSQHSPKPALHTSPRKDKQHLTAARHARTHARTRTHTHTHTHSTTTLPTTLNTHRLHQQPRPEGDSEGVLPSLEASASRPSHLLARGTEVRDGDAVVGKAGAGPAVLAEDLLHGKARLEPVGPRALSIGGRPGQVGLQLGLQVLGEGGTEGSGHKATPRPALKDQSRLRPGQSWLWGLSLHLLEPLGF